MHMETRDKQSARLTAALVWLQVSPVVPFLVTLQLIIASQTDCSDVSFRLTRLSLSDFCSATVRSSDPRPHASQKICYQELDLPFPLPVLLYWAFGSCSQTSDH